MRETAESSVLLEHCLFFFFFRGAAVRDNTRDAVGGCFCRRGYVSMNWCVRLRMQMCSCLVPFTGTVWSTGKITNGTGAPHHGRLSI